MIHLPSKTAMLSFYMFISMPYTIARAICMHDYDMLPPSHGAYKQTKGGDAWLVAMTWADFKKLFFLQFFPRAKQEHLKREYHSIRQTRTETSTEFMQRFQWGLRRSTLNHLMCMSYTDVAQVANAARNYEILYERDDEDTERPDKRQIPMTRNFYLMPCTIYLTPLKSFQAEEW
nr:hypothetical protein [Tanacetum cinerariifolium]